MKIWKVCEQPNLWCVIDDLLDFHAVDMAGFAAFNRFHVLEPELTSPVVTDIARVCEDAEARFGPIKRREVIIFITKVNAGGAGQYRER